MDPSQVSPDLYCQKNYNQPTAQVVASKLLGPFIAPLRDQFIDKFIFTMSRRLAYLRYETLSNTNCDIGSPYNSNISIT